jgi:choline dehydrogenase
VTAEGGSATAARERPYDYIVVGAGAGGGPLAANLADAGLRVLLLEAGTEGGAERDSGSDSDDYAVPAFHGRATEDPATSWQFFVRHYEDTSQQERDPKYVRDQDGVFYPRAAAVGGCTAHNAMITVYPHDADWDGIAALTGDESWRSDAMRGYFERLEACSYRKPPWMRPANRFLAVLVARVPWLRERYLNGGRHGFGGWLGTSLADPALAVQDKSVLRLLFDAAAGSLTDFLRRPLDPFEGVVQGWVDPNDWRVRHISEGLWQVPLAVRSSHRNGSRERVRDVARRHPDRLVVKTGRLVIRVLIDDRLNAYGVEYVDAPHAYRADPHARAGPLPPSQQALAAREVVLAGGAFNTPQLLKLSGIGPRAELERFGIEVRVDLPAVGRNLQDRYEVGVVSEMAHDFSLLRGDRFRPPAPGEKLDPAYREWKTGRGIYTTNGSLLAIVRRSRRELESPDLFVFGFPAQFTGYYPDYSDDLEQHHNIFTWAVLKAHTINRAGEVLLRSADPRDTPHIVFRYFDEGDDRAGEDLTAVVEGVQIARDIMRRAGDIVNREIMPGSRVRTPEQLRAWVRDQAWGHHASCTCQMGAAGDPSTVVDSRFRVQGVQRLRIVDASVFPRIPGFFIVTSIYMIAEKASDVLLEDADIQVPVRQEGDNHGWSKVTS